MNISLSTQELEYLSIDNQFTNTNQLNYRIKEQHKEIIDKLLPEIDLHFAAVLHNASQNQQKTIQTSYNRFSEFVVFLTDHIEFEDQFVLPEFEIKDPVILSFILEFTEKHDDFEMMIQQLLLDIERDLEPLKELLSFRILLLKIERLHLLLQEHNLLEDLLFSTNKK